MRIASRIALLLPLLAAAACNFPMPTGDDIAGDDDTPGDDDGPKPGADTAYQLRAAEPAIATTGQTLRLEGTFGPTATVHFPGGATQDATILGPHRATVTVPAGATAGDLTVETAGATLGPLPFRRTTFALGLQPFESPFAQSNGQRQSATLAVSRQGHAALVMGEWLYVIGGKHAGMYLDSIERAMVNADGSLGPFETVTQISLGTPRAGHTVAVAGSFVYVIGGANNGGSLASVERATVAADGTLGGFSEVPDVRLATPRADAAAVIVGKSLYEVGGLGTGLLSSVEKATINADGSLSTFSIVDGLQLVSGRSNHSAIAVGSSLYVLGGTANRAPLGSVERARIQPDGSLAAFAEVTGTKMTARTGHSTTVFGGHLYNIGGTGTTGRLATVERAEIADDDSLGMFEPVGATLKTAREGQAGVLIAPYVYLIGGAEAATELDTVERASINEGGALTSFATRTSGLRATRAAHNSVVIGHYLYAIGGVSDNTVERALIHPDGTLGEFELTSSAVPDRRVLAGAVVIRNYVYMVGGRNLIAFDSLLRASIDADGNLSSFAEVPGTKLTQPRSSNIAVVLGPYLYVFGDTQAANAHTIERAAIRADGTLGSFATVSSTTQAARYDAAHLVVGDSIYLLGGNVASQVEYLQTVERTSIAPDGGLSFFESVPQLQQQRAGMSTLQVGNSIYVIGGGGGPFALSQTVERTDLNTTGRIGSFTTQSGVTLAPRYAATTSVLGNHGYVLGGHVGLEMENTIQVAELR